MTARCAAFHIRWAGSRTVPSVNRLERNGPQIGRDVLSVHERGHYLAHYRGDAEAVTAHSCCNHEPGEGA